MARWWALPLLGVLVLLPAPALPLETRDGTEGTLQGGKGQQGGPQGVQAEKKYNDPPIPKDDYFPDPSKVVQLSWRPRAFLFPNFLSDAECDYIVNYSRPRVARSTVVGHDGKGAVDNIRTSSGSFFDKQESRPRVARSEVVGADGKGAIDNIRTSSGSHFDKWTNPVIKRIEERVAAWTHIPIDNQEPMQVLKYVDGQKYGSHYDFSESQANLTGGQRYCTVLMYLSDVEHGGETVFPNSEREKIVKDDTWSDCGKQGVAVKPRKGNALLFFSMKPDGKFDATALHSGCPVLKGEKWSATKWIHTVNYGPPYRDPDLCVDDNEECEHWAQMGECERNPKYMKGYGRGQSELGFCRKSCRVCTEASNVKT